jgi:imidazolonepropionase-like amidohydrolase
VSERWRLPSTILPEGDQRDLWVVDGHLTAKPVDDAVPLPGRYSLPGLVDAHAHLALVEGPARGTVEGVWTSLLAYRGQGVLLVRDVGAPRSVTLDIRPTPDLPRLQAAGRWLARRDRFFPELHEPVEPNDLVASAVAEIRRGARWVKVVADWRTPELAYPVPLLRRLADAVHTAGARLAVHTQWEGVREVVAAGADSVEHGCRIDEATIDDMAERGTAWTPTVTVFVEPPPPDASPEKLANWEHDNANYRRMLPLAAARGVIILAGTDLGGSVVDEVWNLIACGLTPMQALRAATVDAREFLGEPSLETGEPADLITLSENPLDDPTTLERPAAIVLGGVRVS